MNEAMIRVATVVDAESIGRFQTRCWDQTYRGVVPDEFLDSVDAETRERRWRERIASGERAVYLAHRGNELIGVASTEVTRSSRPDLPAIELASLYVDRSAHGQGVAQQLLAVAIGTAPAHLLVFDSNARAQSFYLKHGFRPTDERQIDGGTGVAETRWVRPGRSPNADG